MTQLNQKTKLIQANIGVTADGIYGPNTANAIIAKLGIVQDNTPGFELEYDCITSEQYWKIIKVLRVFENNSIEPKYSTVTILNDGAGGRKQITLAIGFTQEGGALDEVIKKYMELSDGGTANILAKYYPTKGRTILHLIPEFINALKAAGDDPLMQEAQDYVFDKNYFKPAYNWCKTNGFKLPLSFLIFSDSYLHSGQVRQDIRNMFKEVPPAKGGDEKAYDLAYCTARRSWLANHSIKLLHNTVVRQDNLLTAIKNNNWNLDKPIKARNTEVL